MFSENVQSGTERRQQQPWKPPQGQRNESRPGAWKERAPSEVDVEMVKHALQQSGVHQYLYDGIPDADKEKWSATKTADDLQKIRDHYLARAALASAEGSVPGRIRDRDSVYELINEGKVDRLTDTKGRVYYHDKENDRIYAAALAHLKEKSTYSGGIVFDKTYRATQGRILWFIPVTRVSVTKHGFRADKTQRAGFLAKNYALARMSFSNYIARREITRDLERVAKTGERLMAAMRDGKRPDIVQAFRDKAGIKPFEGVDIKAAIARKVTAAIARKKGAEIGQINIHSRLAISFADNGRSAIAYDRKTGEVFTGFGDNKTVEWLSVAALRETEKQARKEAQRLASLLLKDGQLTIRERYNILTRKLDIAARFVAGQGLREMVGDLKKVAQSRDVDVVAAAGKKEAAVEDRAASEKDGSSMDYRDKAQQEALKNIDAAIREAKLRGDKESADSFKELRKGVAADKDDQFKIQSASVSASTYAYGDKETTSAFKQLEREMDKLNAEYATQQQKPRTPDTPAPAQAKAPEQVQQARSAAGAERSQSPAIQTQHKPSMSRDVSGAHAAAQAPQASRPTISRSVDGSHPPPAPRAESAAKERSGASKDDGRGR